MAFYKLGTREGGVNPTGNAVEANVLKDKTFSNASGINKIGTMPDNSTTTSNGTVPGINSSYPNIPIRPGSNLQMGVNTDGVKQLAIEPPQGYYPGGGSSYIGVDADDLGDAVASDVVSGKTFTSESGIEVVGTMPNNGAVSPSALSPNGSYTIPEGYHNGNGVVTASPNTGTYSPTTRNAALDMGISNLNRYVNTTGVPNSNTETYTASSRGASLDMGATNSYRYVNTNGVPNSNSGTYTFPANDTGGTKDLGETNTYRYVNASNVYNKGIIDSGVLYELKISHPNTNGTKIYLTIIELVSNTTKVNNKEFTTGNVGGNPLFTQSVDGITFNAKIENGASNVYSGTYNVTASKGTATKTKSIPQHGAGNWSNSYTLIFDFMLKGSTLY